MPMHNTCASISFHINTYIQNSNRVDPREVTSTHRPASVHRRVSIQVGSSSVDL